LTGEVVDIKETEEPHKYYETSVFPHLFDYRKRYVVTLKIEPELVKYDTYHEFQYDIMMREEFSECAKWRIGEKHKVSAYLSDDFYFTMENTLKLYDGKIEERNITLRTYSDEEDMKHYCSTYFHHSSIIVLTVNDTLSSFPLYSSGINFFN